MCGIAGIVGKQINTSVYQDAVQKMINSLIHRGPNFQGIWNDKTCFLGHSRLSIIDLSEAGNQPFKSKDGRYVMVYNGELYNYKELKFELQRAEHNSENLPYIFETNTDTEVILAAYLRWGVKCLERFNGMFAFSVWDNVEQKLLIARDRLGIKPLYYYHKNNEFAFASEIRALIKSGLVEKKINLFSVSEYLQYGTVHAPNTILQDVFMLMPGHFLEIKNNAITIKNYWNINQFAKMQSNLSYQETCTKVNELLTDSVHRQLVADVPFGAFLSGGIDSSIIVGLMSKLSTEKIKTFNISFDESEFSESTYAKQIAQKYNTEHHEIKLTPNDFLKQLPEALVAMDHPSGDGPNSYIVSKATKNAGITMALSGLGGDELFAGYDVFKRLYDLQKKSWLNLVPGFARNIAGLAIKQRKKTIAADKTAEILALPNITVLNAYSINRKLFNQKDYQSLLKNKLNDSHFILDRLKNIKTDKQHILSKISLFEMQTYMQNVLLRDTDQMSMAVALEVRVPFLDHKLMEFILGVNDSYKYPHSPKKLLVDSFKDMLPAELINRPKMGFVLPWKEWLKEDLKEFCNENIIQFSERNFVNKDAIISIWNRFLNNDPKITWSRIWHLVVLNNWINTNNIEC